MMVGEQPRAARSSERLEGCSTRRSKRPESSAAPSRNAVKHFKFEPRGKRRLHNKPNADEIAACRPWLLAEIAIVDPRLILALGATAAQSLMGRVTPVSASRGGTLTTDDGRSVRVAVHPSALLRIVEPAEREPAYAQFVADLRNAASAAFGE